MTQKGGHLSSNGRALTRYGRVVPAKVGKEYEEGAKRKSRNENDGITCQSSSKQFSSGASPGAPSNPCADITF